MSLRGSLIPATMISKTSILDNRFSRISCLQLRRRLTAVQTMNKDCKRFSSRECLVQNLHGFVLFPNSTGLHTFYCVVDDIADVFISSIDDESVEKRKIIKIRSYTPRFLPFLDRIKSTPIQLEADKRYFLEADMAEFSGADFFTLGVRYCTSCFHHQ